MRIFIVSILLVTLSFSANSQQKDYLDHMNELTATFDNLKNDTWGYLKAITKGKKARKVEKKRIALVKQYQQEKERISKIMDTDLQVAMLKYVDLSITVLEEDFSKILDMEEIAEDSYDDMEAYITAKEQASFKLDQASDEVTAAQVAFAATHGIDLLEEKQDDLTKKIEEVSEALAYYSDVYLIFFKPFKEEAYALEAINSMNLEELESKSVSLNSTAEEGLAMMKTLGAYKGYGGLKVATDKLLKFYIKESEESFPSISAFFTAKERYDKAAENVNGKSKKRLSQTEIDEYNSTTEEFNEAVNDYNEVNENLNSERSKVLESWNKAVERFFESQTN